MNLMNGRCERHCPYVLSEVRRREQLGEHIASQERIRTIIASFPETLSELDRDLGSTVMNALDSAGLEDDELMAAEAEWQTTEKLNAIDDATTYGEFSGQIDAEIAEARARIAESLTDQELLLDDCWRGPKRYSGADAFASCRSSFRTEYEDKTSAT